MTVDNDPVVELALALPKAELHVHIEGTLEPELAFELARRNGVPMAHASVEALRAAYDFSDLQSFLDLYYACASVLRTADDFRDLTLAYLRRAAEDGVIHAEIFFDPQTHTERGVSLAIQLDGIEEGARIARAESGITTKLILCFLRHLPEEDGFAALAEAEAEAHLDRIHGFGLDSSELGHPPAKYERLFARCRELGKPVVAHAGEEGPAAFINEALDLLSVVRVDHGVRAADDEAVMERLAREGIPLTVCPLSNTRLKVFAEMRDHTLPVLLDRGLRVTINSDDPAYFGGYMGDNIRAVQAAFGFGPDTWYRLARHSLEASLVDDDTKAGWIERLDAVFQANGSRSAAKM